MFLKLKNILETMVGMPLAAVATPVQLTSAVCTSVVQTMPTVQQQHAHQQTVQVFFLK